MLAAALLAAAFCVWITVGLIWIARRVRVGARGALALARKLMAPSPGSAMDWPELRVREVIAEPDDPAVVLLVVARPGYPSLRATLLLAIQSDGPGSLDLLARWRDASASVSPVRRGEECELRGQQGPEFVHGLLIAEDAGETGLLAH